MLIRVSDTGAIPRAEAPPELLEAWRARFTFDNPLYWEARRNRRPCKHIPRSVASFEEDATTFHLPRGALREVYERDLKPLAPAFQDETVFPPRVPIAFRGELRDYQAAAIQACQARRGGVIVAPTGSGKTVIALALIALVETPVLFLVHTGVLLRQTAERMRAFLGIEPGVIGGGRWEVSEVTVATVQTLRTRGFDELKTRFGMVILDECHHCPAYSFRSILGRFPARFRVGLTATPERQDRLHPILFDVVGPIAYSIERPVLEEARTILRPQVVDVETAFRYFYRRNAWTRMIESLTRNAARNELVCEMVSMNHRQRSLVTTERVAHAERLAALLEARFPGRVGLVHGQMPREQVQQVLGGLADGQTPVVVATTSMIGEGFDLPDLDALFLTVPHGNPTKTAQLLGRILRPSPGKEMPRVVDFADVKVPILRSLWLKRKKVYTGDVERFPQDD
jgi:superfamily II DNA or RNA helicase